MSAARDNSAGMARSARGPGETSWKRVIDAGGLPTELAGLARRVVRRTRLWGGERADIARELVAHFRDGLDAGRSPGELVEAFGDPVAAARLMRSAKRRQRAWPWRALGAAGRVAGWGAAAALVVYAGLAARYYTATPTVRINPVRELNAAALAVPEDQRAWPLYREALMKIGPAPVERRPAGDTTPTLTELRPWMPGWERAREYVGSVAGALETVRRAAARPALGIVVGNRLADEELERALTPADAAHAAGTPAPAESRLDRPDNPSAIGVLLPHLGRLRWLGQLLEVDAWAAAETGDSARVAADVRALGGVARHAWEPPVIISQLVSVATHARQARLVRELLARRPGTLGDADLVALAHELSAYRGGSIRIDFDAERRLFFEDTVQRMYTDDGRGDGRLTYAGARAMGEVAGGFWAAEPSSLAERLDPLGPITSVAMASRRQLVEAYGRVVSETERWAATPVWARGEPPDPERTLGGGVATRERYLTMFLLMPALTYAVTSADRATAERDATLVAIALELHRRQTGAWPASLAELPTRLLPAVPPDPFDGKALKYRREGDRVVLYSIGVDRVDGGGTRPASRDAAVSGWMTAEAAKARLANPQQAGSVAGDWVLWEVPAPPPPPDPAP